MESNLICEGVLKVFIVALYHDKVQVVYLCIFFYSMQSYFALPGWRHACIKKISLLHKCAPRKNAPPPNKRAVLWCHESKWDLTVQILQL